MRISLFSLRTKYNKACQLKLICWSVPFGKNQKTSINFFRLFHHEIAFSKFVVIFLSIVIVCAWCCLATAFVLRNGRENFSRGWGKKIRYHVISCKQALCDVCFQAVKEYIRRAKAWRNREWGSNTEGKPKSYLISLLVVRACETGNPHDAHRY